MLSLNNVLVGSYLSAIVGANLLVTYMGQWALPITAFLLIPFDLVARDVLHETWAKDGRGVLFAKLGALILGGSFIAFLINSDAKQIAIASCVTFASVGIINTTIYQALSGHGRLFKMNTSNIISAIADSLIFPMIAFGIFDIVLFITQSGSKAFGGVAWALLFIKGKRFFSDKHKGV